MNINDIQNIRKIIESRKEIELSSKGDLSTDSLKDMSTDDLTELLNKSQEKHIASLIPEVKECTDYIFSQVHPDENVIILTEVYGPTSSNLITNYKKFPEFTMDNWNNWCNTVDMLDKSKEFYKIYKKLVNLVHKELDCPNARKYFKGQGRLNEYWAGFIGIMRDYKLVAFTGRPMDSHLGNRKEIYNLEDLCMYTY